MEGHTLYVEPGVKVALRGPYTIDVKGTVLAEGTADQGILFTHSNPLKEWNSITYDTPNDPEESRFEYCTFEYSHSLKYSPYNSGGVFAIRDFDEIVFRNSTFRYNSVDQPGGLPPSGGAIGLWGASPLIDSCRFYDNSAEYGGAIICYMNSDPEIRYSLFHSNQATIEAGAIVIFEDCAPQLINNTITGNHAGIAGGGVSLYECAADSIIFINNIIYGNSCAEGEPGQQVGLTSDNNIASFNYNDIEGGFEGFGPNGHAYIYYASSNIDEDPLFCEPESFYYYLSDDSPCRNAGSGGHYIGALPWDSACLGAPSFTPEPLRTESELTIYPNPSFQGNVTVAFEVKTSGQVRLEIYNLTGAKVAEPIGGSYPAGDHRESFSTSTLPPGIYICRLVVNGDCFSAKFVVMK
jgi:hypothetical protein